MDEELLESWDALEKKGKKRKGIHDAIEKQKALLADRTTLDAELVRLREEVAAAKKANTHATSAMISPITSSHSAIPASSARRSNFPSASTT